MERREGTPPIVDRELEIGRIETLLEGARRGEGRLLFLRGEAGIGKTRLLQEAVERAERLGFAVGSAAALSESVATYRPWTEALRQVGSEELLEDAPPPKLLAVVAFGKQGKAMEKVERPGVNPADSGPLHARLAQLAGDAYGKQRGHGGGGVVVEAAGLHRLVLAPGPRPVGAILEGRESELFVEDLRQLADSVGGSPRQPAAKEMESSLRAFLDGGKYEGIDYARDDAKLRQSRRFENVALGVARKASGSPLLLVLDDLQWADPSSLALLRYVARNTRRSPVLLLGAYRVEEGSVRPHLQEALQGIASEELLDEMDLTGLAREHLKDLAAAFLGPHVLDDAFLDALWRETEGNPLFVREVLRGLEEEGGIAVKAGGKRLVRPLESLELPRRVRDVIQARIERLSKEDRELLEAAAACGTRFTAALLSRVADREEAKVLRGLNSIAKVHGLVRGAAAGYAFDHPAVHEAASEATPEEARREYHLRAAAWLEIAGGRVDEIGEHYYLAGDPRAVPKLREAAEAARARYANAEAIRFYNEALSLESEPDKTREVLGALGFLHRLVGDYAAGVAAYSRALDLARTDREKAGIAAGMATVQVDKGEYERALKSCLEALPLVEGEWVEEEAAVACRIGEVYDLRGNYEKALDYFDRALAIREKIGDQAGLAGSLDTVGNVHFRRGNYEKALEHYRRALAIREKIGDQASIAGSLNHIGNVHGFRGEYEKAHECHVTALAIREKVGDQASIAGSLNNLGNDHLLRGDYDKALKYYWRAVPISERIGHLQFLSNHLYNIGNVYSRRGDYDKALEHQGQALAIREKIGTLQGIAASLSSIGNVHSLRGDFDRALEYYWRAVPIQEKIGDQRSIAESLNNIGNMYSNRGDYDKAVEYFDRALAIREKIGDRVGIAETSTNLSETSIRKRDLSSAERHCERALSVAHHVGNKERIGVAKKVRGMLLRRTGQWENSAADFEESLRISNQVGNPFEEGRTQHEFGLMWKDKGNRERAREHLSQAVHLFERIGAKKELEKARAALQDLP